MATKRPNILIMWGDDIGMWNVSRYSLGMMGYRTPNIDRIGIEGVTFTDYYAQQSCTAGRASFITGQNPIRTGLTKVGMPGATVGLHAEDATIAELLKPLGYATGQFGKNHLGDRDEYLPCVHGFDEFFGNLYHLNAEEEPELTLTIPRIRRSKKLSDQRGVLHCVADGKGGQTIEDTGPLTKKRMETIDEEVTERALSLMDGASGKGRQAVLHVVQRDGHALQDARRRKDTSARAARVFTAIAMVVHDEQIGMMLAINSTSWALPTTPSSCTPPTTARKTTLGPTAAYTPFRSNKEHQLGRCLARALH